MKRIATLVLLNIIVLTNNVTGQKVARSFEYFLTSGYHSVTVPGLGINGFFLQNTIAYHPEPVATISFSANLSKASNYPKGKV